MAFSHPGKNVKINKIWETLNNAVMSLYETVLNKIIEDLTSHIFIEISFNENNEILVFSK